MQTPYVTIATGDIVPLFAPHAATITIEDIAYGLSRIPRWNGQTQGDIPYSVAQHSVDVCERVLRSTGDRHMSLAALLHDAHEYLIGDLATPVKEALFHMGLDKDAFRGFIARIDGVINDTFGLPYYTPGVWRTIIKRADQQAGLAEHAALFPEGAPLYAEWGPLTDRGIKFPKRAEIAEAVFLETFLLLTKP